MSTLAGNEVDPSRTVKVLRRMLLGLVALGLVGNVIELFLLDHTEGVWQWVPIGLMGFALLSQGTLAFAPRRGSVRLFQAAMLLLFAGGMAGLALHFKGNLEWEREINPDRAGWKLYWGVLKGATPALAPGMLLLLGCLGLVGTFHHPALAAPGDTRESSKEH